MLGNPYYGLSTILSEGCHSKNYQGERQEKRTMAHIKLMPVLDCARVRFEWFRCQDPLLASP